jgi:glycosyltransferase involved in cell wall biosynthesis
MILGVFPELLTAGGIQRIGCHTAAVLASFARDQKLACQLLSLNDPAGHHEVQVGSHTFTIRGLERRKTQLFLSVLTAAPKTRLAYIAHPNLAPLGLLLKCIRPSVHYLVATYGIDAWEPLPLLRRLSLQFAQAVAPLSQFTADKMIAAQRLNPEKATVLPPALDPEFLTWNDSATDPVPPLPKGKILLTVARLAASEQYKGVETVIQALPAVLRVVPDVYYVIVGDGDDRMRLERLARDTFAADHILFAGVKIGDALSHYYRACDIFVMPSREEGFGVVFLEAMAFGKPVIGGNHGGTPEIVKDGVNGFLVQYGDVDTLSDRLICLLHNAELRNRMGGAGRQHVEENYTFERFHQRLVRLLHNRG